MQDFFLQSRPACINEKVIVNGIGKHLNALPEKTKETIILFDVADLSLEEICEIQGGTISGVKSRLKRGRESVQKNLGIVTGSEKKNFRAMKYEIQNPPMMEKGEYYAL